MMNMSGTGGYILHAFKMYAITSLLSLYLKSDISTVLMILTHKRYSYAAKKSVRWRNQLKPRREQSQLVGIP